MAMKYDYVVVGAGLFGSVFAREATNKGYSCLVIDKRNHIAGNCFTELSGKINIHKYGPHIFHTNNTKVWNYVNQFTCFNNYTHKVKANYQNNIYSFPINLMTLYQLCGVCTPLQAKSYLNSIRTKNNKPQNLEEWAISKVGQEIYEIFIKGYTHKQWNKHPQDLPSSIIQRIPIRLNFNDNYFNDTYQGIPIHGYTEMFKNILYDIPVFLETDYFSNRDKFDNMCKTIVYTGPIDEFFEYEHGELEWRSLRFEELYFDSLDYQGCSIVNYTDYNVPYTRIVEHKHFQSDSNKIKNTIITKEYPQNYQKGLEKFYPVDTHQNKEILNKYQGMINKKKYIFGGRLAEYKYYDMHQVVASALSFAKKHFQ